MSRLLCLALLAMAPAVHAQVIEVHIHIHLESEADKPVARADCIERLGRVLDTAVMTSLEDNPSLKAKLPAIKARVSAIRPTTANERKAISALKRRIREYDADIKANPHAREFYEEREFGRDRSDDYGDDYDWAGVAAG